MEYTLKALCALIPEGQLSGYTDATLCGIASLEGAQLGDLSFLSNLKYKKHLALSKASVVLIPKAFEADPLPNQAYLQVPNPSLALAKVCADIERTLTPAHRPGIHPSAIVAPSAVVDPSAYVGPLCVIEAQAKIAADAVLQSHVFIGQGAQIGSRSWLFSGVRVLERCCVGSDVRIHSNAVIGSDGYGYEFHEGKYLKLPQIGNVIIEDWVEIGANTTIDRGRFGATHIQEGTKIDNLVQIAHNVVIGKNCLIVAQAGIAGSTHLEDYVVVGGQAGIAGHLNIGQGSQIGAQSGLNHNLDPKSFVRGTPALPFMAAHRIDILKQRLPDLFKRVERLEK